MGLTALFRKGQKMPKGDNHEVTKADVAEACRRREKFDAELRGIGDLIRHGCISAHEAGWLVEKLAQEWYER